MRISYLICILEIYLLAFSLSGCNQFAQSETTYLPSQNLQSLQKTGTITNKTGTLASPVPTFSGNLMFMPASSGKCLDDPNWSTKAPTPLQQWECTQNQNQLFSIQNNSTGSYTIVNNYNHLCLEVSSGNSANGTSIQFNTCNGTTGQNFNLNLQSTAVPKGYEIISVLTKKCLDVKGSSTANGVLIQQWDCSGSANQVFSLTAGNGQPPVAAADTILGGTVTTLINQNSGKCLDDTAWGTANGTILQQWDCSGALNQQFVVKSNSNNTYSFINNSNGKCLDVSSGALSNGASIDFYDCNGTPAQTFTAYPVPGSANYSFVSSVSNKCLDVTAKSTVNGAKIQQSNCTGEASQIFHLNATL